MGFVFESFRGRKLLFMISNFLFTPTKASMEKKYFHESFRESFR